MHVAVLYEAFSTGLRARQVIQEVARLIDFELDFDLTLWRFDLLPQPDLLPLVAHEAKMADFVLLSGHGDRELPAAVKQRCLNWLANRGKEPSAFAVSLDATAKDILGTMATLNRLQSAAALAGVDVLVSLCDAPHKAEQFTLADIRHRAEATTLVLEESLRERATQSYQHWGINE